jgi:hypothetical protein
VKKSRPLCRKKLTDEKLKAKVKVQASENQSVVLVFEV